MDLKITKFVLTILAAVLLSACGDEPVREVPVNHVDVEYSVDLSADLVTLLNTELHYYGDEGVAVVEKVTGQQIRHKARFTKFPAAFGMKLLVKSMNESALTKPSYTLRITYSVSAASYDNDGNVVQNCPLVSGDTYMTTVSSANIKAVLERDVKNGEYFSTSNDIDRNGKIIVSAN